MRSGRRARHYHDRVHYAQKVATSAPGKRSIADPWYRMNLGFLAAQRPRSTPSFRPLHPVLGPNDGDGASRG